MNRRRLLGGLVGVAALVGLALVATLSAQEEAAPEAQRREALGALLAGAAHPLEREAACDHDRADTTLGDDLARYLALLESGAGRVEARCGLQDGERRCEVVIGQDDGELVWSRHYRFRLADTGQLADKGLECFTIP